MRPYHGQLDAPRTGMHRRLCGLRRFKPRCAHCGAGKRLNLRGNAREKAISSRSADQSEAGREMIPALPRWHGNGGQIQQIDKIGIGAEVGIIVHRLFGKLHHRIGARNGRHHHHIKSGPCGGGLAFQRRQLIGGLKAGDRIIFARALDDGPGHRVKNLRHCFQQSACGGIALGHPRPLIKQARHRIKRLHIKLDHIGTGCAQAGDIPLESGLGEKITKKFALIFSGHPETQVRRRSRKLRHRQFPRINIRRIISGCHLTGEKGIGDIERKDGDRVQCAAGWNHAGHGQRAKRRLQSDNAVERRRHTAGPCRIGAKRERHDSRPDRRC